MSTRARTISLSRNWRYVTGRNGFFFFLSFRFLTERFSGGRGEIDGKMIFRDETFVVSSFNRLCCDDSDLVVEVIICIYFITYGFHCSERGGEKEKIIIDISMIF